MSGSSGGSLKSLSAYSEEEERSLGRKVDTMRKTSTCYNGCSDAGIRKGAREDICNAMSANTSDRGRLAGLEAESREPYARNKPASALAPVLRHPDQRAIKPIHVVANPNDSFLEVEHNTEDIEDYFVARERNLSSAFQTDQEAIISDTFPNFISEPFNPADPKVDRGTIDPRTNPSTFEELLKSFHPKRFSLLPTSPLGITNVCFYKMSHRLMSNKRPRPAYDGSSQVQHERVYSQGQYNMQELANLAASHEKETERRIDIADPLPRKDKSRNTPEPSKTNLASTRASSKSEPEANNEVKEVMGPANLVQDPYQRRRTSEAARKDPSQGTDTAHKSDTARETNTAYVTGPAQGPHCSQVGNPGSSKWTDAETKAAGAILREIREEDKHRVKPVSHKNMFAEASIRLRARGINRQPDGVRGHWIRYCRDHPEHGFNEKKNLNSSSSCVGKQENRSQKRKAAAEEDEGQGASKKLRKHKRI